MLLIMAYVYTFSVHRIIGIKVRRIEVNFMVFSLRKLLWLLMNSVVEHGIILFRNQVNIHIFAWIRNYPQLKWKMMTIKMKAFKQYTVQWNVINIYRKCFFLAKIVFIIRIITYPLKYTNIFLYRFTSIFSSKIINDVFGLAYAIQFKVMCEIVRVKYSNLTLNETRNVKRYVYTI